MPALEEEVRAVENKEELVRLWEQFAKEQLDFEILYLPDNIGIVLYRIVGKEFHIGHTFLTKEDRGQGALYKFSPIFETLALEAGCDHISGLVVVDDDRPEKIEQASRNLKIFRQYGCSVLGFSNGKLILVKDLNVNGKQ